MRPRMHWIGIENLVIAGFCFIKPSRLMKLERVDKRCVRIATPLAHTCMIPRSGARAIAAARKPSRSASLCPLTLFLRVSLTANGYGGCR